MFGRSTLLKLTALKNILITELGLPETVGSITMEVPFEIHQNPDLSDDYICYVNGYENEATALEIDLLTGLEYDQLLRTWYPYSDNGSCFV